ncbi:GlcNAc-PI de-N-acetylase [Streptomyces agglomeratus]|uniref:GlcNAc-PI de-N-acetylase n=1 Tax=Streptomyces agglomeratus TaxID=285458 RepID=A0A1E5P4V1_9ACTN|nr:PIG-L deacetylase family protein [Streptomyces agglomeratus]OEJ24563.1 GlcNAc-PI de-N-acetylase [Streptomyces agglomeratus]OEJ41485.1 GlcNAc-PI de-N-acetylase [Streptomyces agglomeratus]OEJ44136.1 GlcNAc-PI de-N-acetylase [Streptomyces agglomeratus]OEJ53975.1 GlcNAc-PI de-N-acetylase [Streptomyces agglomeratus]OEJ61350.1 GlcNAc-PI de-N-acetylase [Streptomyces agglomeratus]
MADPYAPMPDDWERALAVVAHPDDLEYGPACAVAAWTAAGREVTYLMVTRGQAGMDTMEPAEAAQVREREEWEAAAVVGVKKVEFLDHPDGVVEYGLPLRRDITAAIRRHRPEILITLNFHERWRGGDWNSPDHRHVGRALLDAAGDAGNRWIFPELAAEGLQPWKGVRYVAVGGSPFAAHAVDVTGTLDQGVAALEAHRSYLDYLGPDHPMADARGFLERKVRTFGERFGGKPAIAFELIGV